MRKKLLIGAAIVFAVAPIAAFAEEAAAGTDGTSVTPTPSPTAIDSGSFGASNPATIFPEPAPAAREVVPQQKPLLRESPTRASAGKTGVRLNNLPPGAPVEGRVPHMASGTPPRDKMMEERDMRMGRRASSSDERMERMMEARKKMLEQRLEIVKRMIAQQVHRLEAMIERLTKLADRLDSRIKKIESAALNQAASSTGNGAGKVNVRDISMMKSSLATARTEIDKAKAALAAAKGKVDTALSAAESRVATGDVDGDGKPDVLAVDGRAKDAAMMKVDLAKDVREELQKAREAVFAAHKALVEAISSLSRGQGDEKRVLPTVNKAEDGSGAAAGGAQ